MEMNPPVFPGLGLTELALIPIIILLAAWSLVWKGIALWKAARNGCKVWYVIFLLINTLGILEILYIFVFSKSGAQEGSSTCCNCNR